MNIMQLTLIMGRTAAEYVARKVAAKRAKAKAIDSPTVPLDAVLDLEFSLIRGGLIELTLIVR